MFEKHEIFLCGCPWHKACINLEEEISSKIEKDRHDDKGRRGIIWALRKVGEWS